MKQIYLICQKAIETDKPEYLQSPESIPIFGVDSLEKANKEISSMKKDEDKRRDHFKRFGLTMPVIFEFEWIPITVY